VGDFGKQSESSLLPNWYSVETDCLRRRKLHVAYVESRLMTPSSAFSRMRTSGLRTHFVLELITPARPWITLECER
jgi:hypothetical protein